MLQDQFIQSKTYVDGEQQRIATWNASQEDYPLDMSIAQLIAQQAASRPDAVALVAGDQALTYGDLNRRANQLAHYLQTLGVGPNSLVSVCVERSLDLVIGLLGVLKAGGAYVPLDPGHPPARLRFTIEDACTPVLVTQQHLLARLPMLEGQRICLDSDAPLLAQQSAGDPALTATLDDLAYIIYTSGSTGHPKGVQITRGNLLNLVFWHRQAFEVTSVEHATQLTSPAFDATGWEIWPYLTAGACVYFFDDNARVSPEICRDWLLAHDITITFLPTALAESVLTLEWPRTAALRLLLTGADTLQHYPSPDLPFTLINNYGPTEATVVAISGRVLPTDHPVGPPALGHPIANTQIYLLDEHLQQVAIGEAGELYIGGAGVAQGYLNLPTLTDERFVAHPFSTEPGARLYKTGDMARYLPDGQIAFIGRADYQIKLRGYRIEPGEISALLNAHPKVQNSLVMGRADTHGEQHLVAYLVLVPGAQTSANELRETVAEHLPDYMIPVAFVLLDALPATPNGKVDRAALPTPDASNTLGELALTQPETPSEKRLAGVVTSLLGIKHIGIDDNFFLLGGNSMLGTQLIMQIAKLFSIDLPLLALFEAPTIRSLASEVEQRVVARIEAMSDEEVLRLLEQE